MTYNLVFYDLFFFCRGCTPGFEPGSARVRVVHKENEIVLLKFGSKFLWMLPKQQRRAVYRWLYVHDQKVLTSFPFGKKKYFFKIVGFTKPTSNSNLCTRRPQPDPCLHKNYSCTGCYKLRNEVPTERVYLLIENYIQTPLADPIHSGSQ